MLIRDDCLFCVESQIPENARTFLSDEWPFENRLIYADDLTYAVPGYSPQIYPYALVLPRRHVFSMLSTSPDERVSIIACLSALTRLPAYQASPLYVFEHGGCTREAHGNSCLEHAHFHVISNRVNIFSRFVQEHDVRPFSFEPTGEALLVERYLFAGVFTSQRVDGFLVPTHVPERQYFRRIIASEIGDPRWNWRLGINEHLMLALKECAETHKRQPNDYSG
jgi:diadenosine tetraphosphate (Ap4A) HIT family hydrolase